MQTVQHTYTVGLRNKRCKIWHDPPSVLKSNQQLSSIFKGSTAGANANIMMDSGAAADCISVQYCKKIKLKISPLPAKEQISGISGQAEHVTGMATVRVSIQGYRTTLRLLAIPMVPDCDAILGEPWHTSTKAVTQ